MANPWGIAGLTAVIGALIAILGWFLNPSISWRLSRFFSDLTFDAPRKLRQLEIHTIPELKDILMVVEKVMMVRSEKDKVSESDLKILYTLSGDLKSALYEAEDILDLIDYHRIEKRVTSDAKQRSSSCQQCLHAVGAFTAPWFGRCIDFARAALQQCIQRLCLFVGDTLNRSGSILPDSNAPSVSRLQSLRRWFRHLVTTLSNCYQSILNWSTTRYLVSTLSNCYQSILNWSITATAALRFCLDRSFEFDGIKSNKKDDITMDSFLPTADRKRLRKRIEHIENILNDSKKSHLLSQHSSSSRSISEDTGRQEEITKLYTKIDRKVFGRDEERERICIMLRKGSDADGPSSSSCKPYSVFGIHGITGSGKTTLAQYVCDHEKKAEDKHFDPIMFIHVSETFRLEKIFRDMLSEITKGQQSDSNSVIALHDDLKGKLKGKRFLLVLDNLWANDEFWEGRDALLDTLNAGQWGSRILVTAQREDAAAALGAQEQNPIPDLEEEQFFSMFMHYALELKGAISDQARYISIGRKIAKKLRRSPLAAKTVAARLHGKSIDFWETTANNVVMNEIMGALWWSYQQLGADVRQCFAYCSTFPRGYELERGELVRIWIAHGFVNTSNHATEELEDVGNRYFDELLAFSFLEVNFFFGDRKVFTTHDLLHELAERVVGSDFHRIDLNGSLKDIPPGVRHVFIETNNEAKVVVGKSLDLGNLRTLIIKECCTYEDRKQPMDDIKEVFDCLFMTLRELRVLIVELEHELEVLSVPASVDRMKHLRYLGFQFFCSPKELNFPSTFSNLYHMQTIDVYPDCLSTLEPIQLVSYSEDMANLVHLRHITTWKPFPNIGRLTSLQTLPVFKVKEEQGYELKQLKHLNKLRGTLRIEGLGIVRSKEQALEADIACKERVTTLVLHFDNNTCNDPDVTAEVFEGLCPPKDLVELQIYHYKGSRYPSWMLSRQHPDIAPKRLQKLKLYRCSRLASIPEDCELFIHLCDLRIHFCDWDCLPENMERLVSLQNLLIYGCDKMELLPTLPQYLQNIRIIRCRVLSTTCEQEGHENWHKIKHIPRKYIVG